MSYHSNFDSVSGQLFALQAWRRWESSLDAPALSRWGFFTLRWFGTTGLLMYQTCYIRLPSFYQPSLLMVSVDDVSFIQLTKSSWPMAAVGGSHRFFTSRAIKGPSQRIQWNMTGWFGTTVMVMLWYQWSNKNHCFQWTFHGHMVFWTGLQNDKVFRLALIWRWSRILLQRLHRTFPSLLGLLWSLEVIVLWIKLTHRGGLQVLRKDRRRMSLCQSFC